MDTELSQRFLDKWQSLTSRLGLEESRAHEVGRYLLHQYSAPGRHYHTVRHIVSMLDGFEALRHKFQQPLAAELAIFFHDAVYDPASRENEEQSSHMMIKMLSDKLDNSLLDAAAYSINATKKLASTDNPDTNLILDLDMAILGQPWAVYEHYAEGVLKEYLPVYGEDDYSNRRAERFLKSMIARGDIFFTPEFKHLNEQAIKNMKRESEILASGKSFSGRAVA